MLLLNSRYRYMDAELGMVVEPDVLPPDIYPFQLIEDTDNDIKGSCTQYYTRLEKRKKIKTLS